MLNTGFGYQSWNAKRGAAPSPAQMGQHLQAQAQPAAMPSLGLASMLGNDAAPPDELEMLDTEEGYDPSAEHSPASTRAALEDAIRRSRDTSSRPALKRPPMPGQRWQMATLGLSPLEIQLFEQTGDLAGGPGGVD